MSVLDPFNDPWFSMTSLTGMVDKMDFVPQYLDGLGIFDPEPVQTYKLFVDRRDQTLSLVPTSPLGAPPSPIDRDNRDTVTLSVPRIAQDFTLNSHELIGLRGFNTENTFANYQTEFLRRFQKMQRKRLLTEEFHRLGAVQGKLLDADGTTVIHNYYTLFGVSEPAEIDFELSDATFNVKAAAEAVVRTLTKASRGAFNTGTSVHCLASDELYDGIRYHASVEKWYLNWSAAREHQNTGPYQSFPYGGIVWHNYRGTDDGSTVSIPANKGRIFPVGAMDTFKRAMGPAEFGPYMNTPGREFYAYNLPDTSGRAAFTKGELYGYNLFFCQRPDLLRAINVT